MPGEEVPIEMDNTGSVDVDDCPVKVAVDRSWVLGLIKIRRLFADAVDRVGEGFAIPGR